jgi:hypothetical protein
LKLKFTDSAVAAGTLQLVLRILEYPVCISEDLDLRLRLPTPRVRIFEYRVCISEDFQQFELGLGVQEAAEIRALIVREELKGGSTIVVS